MAMTIVSIIRKTYNNDIPSTFTLGCSDPLNEDLVVKEIKFFETGYGSGKMYRGRCYVVKFKGTSIVRVMPAEEVIDIAVETSSDIESQSTKITLP